MLGIVYAGDARVALNEAALAELAAAREARNAASGVTGHAYFHGGRLIEYIEGPQEAVEEIITALAQDPRFIMSQLVRSADPVQRRFADWQLDACNYAELMDLRLEHVLEAMLQNLAAGAEEAEGRTEAAVWRLVDAIARRRASKSAPNATRLVYAH